MATAASPRCVNSPIIACEGTAGCSRAGAAADAGAGSDPAAGVCAGVTYCAGAGGAACAGSDGGPEIDVVGDPGDDATGCDEGADGTAADGIDCEPGVDGGTAVTADPVSERTVVPASIGGSIGAGSSNSQDMQATMNAEASPESKTTLQRTRAGGKTGLRMTNCVEPPGCTTTSLAGPARAIRRGPACWRTVPSALAPTGDRSAPAGGPANIGRTDDAVASIGAPAGGGPG
ncbi:MAG: hypothetical protein ABSE20_18840 [Acetobacteraceae bacterium]|jgi:hypothetical protein